MTLGRLAHFTEDARISEIKDTLFANFADSYGFLRNLDKNHSVTVLNYDRVLAHTISIKIRENIYYLDHETEAVSGIRALRLGTGTAQSPMTELQRLDHGMSENRFSRLFKNIDRLMTKDPEPDLD